MGDSIAVRLVVGIVALVAVFLGACAYLNISRSETQLMDQTVQGSRRLTDSIRRGLRYAMLNDDRTAVTHSLSSIGDREDLEGIRIFNKNGRIMFSSKSTELDTKVNSGARACRGCHGRQRPVEVLDPDALNNIYEDSSGYRRLQLIDPIYNEPDCSSAPCHVHPSGQKVLGVLDMEMSLERLDAVIARTKVRQLVLSTVMIAALSVILFLVIRRMVTRPISVLLDGTRKIAAGDLEHRIPSLGNDEIGQLADSFNLMTARLGESRNQLIQSEKLASLGKLSAGVGHELNNPLTSILVFASSILKQMPPDDPDREGIETILKEGERCRNVVAGLLDFARQSPTEISACRIDDLVERAVTIARKQPGFAKVRFTTHGPGDLPPVPMDMGQIQQVFLNLFVNALDAMPDGGSINVAWEPTGDGFVKVDVTDTGRGIPSDLQAKVFEPFFTTKGNQGTGLGLSIAWGIMEKHGGSISVRSEDCSGAVFTVRLPVEAVNGMESS